MKAMERIDVCIICALAEEAMGFKKVLEKQGAIFSQERSQIQRRDYFFTTIPNGSGNPLKLILTWQVFTGMQETISSIGRILQEFELRFVAMTGFCAGNKKRVKLGDIIVADKTFIYDSGGVTEKNGVQEYQRSITTFQMRNDILQPLRIFKDWESTAATLQPERPISKLQQRDWLLNQLLQRQITVLDLSEEELKKHVPNWSDVRKDLMQENPPLLDKETLGLRDPAEFRRMTRRDFDVFPYEDAPFPTCHIGSLASGNAVRQDNPFPELETTERKLLGLDMESTAIYHALQEYPNTRFLVAKGVSDYGDGHKDYEFHAYTAMLSAAYVSSVITHFVNDKYMPWPNESQIAINTRSTPSSTASAPPASQTQTPSQNAGNTKKPVKIFFACSQSPQDKDLLDAFTTHLSVLKRGKQPLIEEWDRHHIDLGDIEAEEIKKQLDQAQIILVMITPDYYNSEFYEQEIQQVELRHTGGARVIPILLRPTSPRWKQAFYGGYRSLPRDDRAVTLWRNRDEVLADITEEIRVVAEKIQNA